MRRRRGGPDAPYKVMALFGKAWLHMVDAMDEVSLLFDNYIHNISIIYP